jgi:hypothetical protein
MRYGSSLLALHNALGQAIHKHLPDITYMNRDWDAWRKMDAHAQGVALKTNCVPQTLQTRRPCEDEVQVHMFCQTWGSTALGYGGMGGAAVTTAYTVIVYDSDCYCVYFGQGELAYQIKYSQLSTQGKLVFKQDIQSQNMASKQNAHIKYV